MGRLGRHWPLAIVTASVVTRRETGMCRRQTPDGTRTPRPARMSRSTGITDDQDTLSGEHSTTSFVASPIALPGACVPGRLRRVSDVQDMIFRRSRKALIQRKVDVKAGNGETVKSRPGTSESGDRIAWERPHNKMNR